jgi:hypothetical protein
VAPYGWITGQSIHYENGVNVAIAEESAWINDPPSEECDASLDGTYLPGACVSPIVIDTSKNPNDRYKLTDLAGGVRFDLNADGFAEQTAWVALPARVAFLALDRNGNGVIDDGSELFGNYTLPGAGNGFAALARLAVGNTDATVDSRDAIYEKLLLWHDLNSNGVSEAGELVPFYTELEAISLTYLDNRRVDRYGNRFKYSGFARQNLPNVDGRQAKGLLRLDESAREFEIYDVFFAGQR